MLYWSLLFFLISIATGIAGLGNGTTHFDSVSHLLASAFFVISVFFLALRYWEESRKKDFLMDSKTMPKRSTGSKRLRMRLLR